MFSLDTQLLSIEEGRMNLSASPSSPYSIFIYLSSRDSPSLSLVARGNVSFSCSEGRRGKGYLGMYRNSLHCAEHIQLHFLQQMTLEKGTE